MSVISNRTVGISFAGDVDAPNLSYSASANSSSPGAIEARALTTGANTITIPTGAKAVTIIPPVANTVTMQLKGITGDIGIRLSLTEPSSIAIDIASTPTFVLTVSGALTLRLIWS